MKKFSHVLVLGAVVACAAFSVTAQELKIGFLNTDRVFREANLSKVATGRLEQEFSRREKEVNEIGEKLKAVSEKFERDAPTLSENQRTTRQKQLVEQDRDFQRKRREFQEDLNMRKNEEMQQVLDRANKVVKTLAESEKYDLILQEAVYMNPKHDITDKVIKALNANAK